MEDWTRGKTKSVSEFDLIDPLANSEEGIILSKIKDLRSKTLPKLLMASSETDFDKIWGEYIKKQEDLGLAKVQAFQQTKYEENKKKLGMQ